VVTARRAPAVQPERYAVQRGDTLWGISAQEQIYQNPFMWPLIYKANSQQIRDPELIFPRQILVIPRNFTPEEAVAAIQRARQRCLAFRRRPLGAGGETGGIQRNQSP
jgi:LysM repeat protein